MHCFVEVSQHPPLSKQESFRTQPLMPITAYTQRAIPTRIANPIARPDSYPSKKSLMIFISVHYFIRLCLNQSNSEEASECCFLYPISQAEGLFWPSAWIRAELWKPLKTSIFLFPRFANGRRPHDFILQFRILHSWFCPYNAWITCEHGRRGWPVGTAPEGTGAAFALRPQRVGLTQSKGRDGRAQSGWSTLLYGSDFSIFSRLL